MELWYIMCISEAEVMSLAARRQYASGTMHDDGNYTRGMGHQTQVLPDTYDIIKAE